MKFRFLGTGNAAGVPLYGCSCEACERAHKNPEFRRSSCCAVIQLEDQCFLIDAGLMDFAERFRPGQITALFVTHYHPDHVQGLFHWRWGAHISPVPVFGPPDTRGCGDLFEHPGWLDFSPRVTAFRTFQHGPVQITALPLFHSKVTFGYLFEYQGFRFAYLTDTVGLPKETIFMLKKQPLDLMIIDSNHPPGCLDNHNDINLVLSLHQQIRPVRTYMTHIGHLADGWLMQHAHELPDNVLIARDGMQLDFSLNSLSLR